MKYKYAEFTIALVEETINEILKDRASCSNTTLYLKPVEVITLYKDQLSAAQLNMLQEDINNKTNTTYKISYEL